MSRTLVAVVVLLDSYGDMRQEGIEEDGCSEGIEEESSKGRIDKFCSEVIKGGSENGFKAEYREGIEGGFVDNVSAAT